MLTKEQRTTLLVAIHREIERNADATARELAREGGEVELSYPPNSSFSEEEAAALQLLPKSKEMVSALRKVIASATAESFFSFFCVLDGVADPDEEQVDWPSFEISPIEEEEDGDDLLHDDFFGTYWIWRYRRPDPGWKLDDIDEEMEEEPEL